MKSLLEELSGIGVVEANIPPGHKTAEGWAKEFGMTANRTRFWLRKGVTQGKVGTQKYRVQKPSGPRAVTHFFDKRK